MSGYQWEKAEAWRRHPLLQSSWKTSFPGIRTGVALFALYVIYDKSKAPAPKH